MNAPKGWRFYTADASIEGECFILLIRDNYGKVQWHSLSETDRVNIDLYKRGRGKTFEQALEKANKLAAEDSSFLDFAI